MGVMSISFARRNAPTLPVLHYTRTDFIRANDPLCRVILARQSAVRTTELSDLRYTRVATNQRNPMANDDRTQSEPQVRSSEWLGVGAVGVIHIVNDMKREARQWKEFASANQLHQKQDYYRGKEDALAELLKVLKVLAPTPKIAE